MMLRLVEDDGKDPGAPPNPDLVRLLEGLLRLAQKGTLRSGAFAGAGEAGGDYMGIAIEDATCSAELYMALGRCQLSLLVATQEGAEEIDPD